MDAARKPTHEDLALQISELIGDPAILQRFRDHAAERMEAYRKSCYERLAWDQRVAEQAIELQKSNDSHPLRDFDKPPGRDWVWEARGTYAGFGPLAWYPIDPSGQPFDEQCIAADYARVAALHDAVLVDPDRRYPCPPIVPLLCVDMASDAIIGETGFDSLKRRIVETDDVSLRAMLGRVKADLRACGLLDVADAKTAGTPAEGGSAPPMPGRAETPASLTTGDADSPGCRPATWFPKGMAARLRKAAAKGRKIKHVATRRIDGVVCYSIADARRWWPTDVPSEA
jgi:hypothetical protein